MVLTLSRNGNTSAIEPHLQDAVKLVFSRFNWSATPDLLDRAVALPSSDFGLDQPPNLRLTVQQFFAAVPWDASKAIPEVAAPIDDCKSFTLDDFSDLF